MEFLQPASWSEASGHEGGRIRRRCPFAGGTDVMVEINLDRHRPAAILDLTRIREARGRWGDRRRFGCESAPGVTYTRLIDETGGAAPGTGKSRRAPLVHPQIRKIAAQWVANLGTASPGRRRAPAAGSRRTAQVELASTSATRRVPVREFFTGPKAKRDADG